MMSQPAVSFSTAQWPPRLSESSNLCEAGAIGSPGRNAKTHVLPHEEAFRSRWHRQRYEDVGNFLPRYGGLSDFPVGQLVAMLNGVAGTHYRNRRRRHRCRRGFTLLKGNISENSLQIRTSRGSSGAAAGRGSDVACHDARGWRMVEPQPVRARLVHHVAEQPDGRCQLRLCAEWRAAVVLEYRHLQPENARVFCIAAWLPERAVHWLHLPRPPHKRQVPAT